jgi:hypothetical protein
MSPTWLPIKYHDFYDIPRAIVVEYRDRLYFFDCPFDDEIDDYQDHFVVYELPVDAKEWVGELEDWSQLSTQGRKIATVRVSEVKLDDTRRQLLDDQIFVSLI